VGDAAHAIHPLAGQGVNLGMADAASLAEALQREQGRHGDCGRLSTLQHYERMRLFDNAAVAQLIHGIEKIFSTDQHYASIARSWGLQLAARSSLGQSVAVKAALGLMRDAPKLARFS
jgi:2-polyprenyl-6-methoxyphenol hydroxylase-like FAD-dependent oxidoreductase